ncbi:MAG TPA: transporter associated domain-containing protein, partial [Thermoanaerobaculaceae bacterium]|nr:transporter associated domain-containing protein [Thermoanaerobaculaceae bacterium]
ARLTGKPVESAPDYVSVAGLLLEIAGRVPPVGSRFQVGELVFEVVEASPRRIERVRVTVSAPAA